VARYPLVAHWTEAEPMTGVDVMARVTDRVRRYIFEGVPAATGLVAVGDALACTNPSLGRGISIAAMHVAALRHTVREVGVGRDTALAYEERRGAEVDGFLADTLATSAHRLAQLEADAAGSVYDPDDVAWRIGSQLLAAAPSDPELLRGALEVGGLLARGRDVVRRPEIASRLRTVGDVAPFPGPDRAEVLSVVGALAAA
jgi:2-polyprenyl-6-methoxyphenol hydroxylase-like FAD-dependent oxidoreductase